MSRRKMLVIVAAAVVVASLAFLALSNSLNNKSGASHVADTFVSQVLSGDIKTTYSELSSTTKQSETQDTWESKVDQVRAYMADNQPSFVSGQLSKSKTQGNSYKALYQIKGTDGTYNMSLLLVQQKEGWRVSVFSTSLKK